MLATPSATMLPVNEHGPPSRTRGRQTAWDMVRSLALVLVVVAAAVLLLPRPTEPVRQPVDVPGAAAAAQAAGAPSVVPDVPSDWTPNAARFDATGPDGVPTWHVGYVTAGERYAGVEMTSSATPQWLDDVTGGGVEIGEQVVRSARWREYLSDDGRLRSLVRESAGVTTVVTGTASLDELVVLAESLG